MAVQTDPTAPIDPNDPTAIIRQRALAQASQTAVDTQTPASSTTPAATPSPTFTNTAVSRTPPVTAPTAGTAPGPTTPQTTFTNTAKPQTPFNGSINGVANFTDPSTASELQRFSSALASNPNNPQQAITTFLNNPANSSLKPMLEPNGTIGLANGTYLVPPGQGGNATGTTWQVVQRSPEEGAGSANGAALTAQPNPFLDQIKQLLMQRLATDSQPVDPSDVSIAQPLSAASDQMSRASDQERKVLAERLYAQGGGNVDQAQLGQQIQQSSETNGLNLATLKSNLITQALTAKQKDLSDAMQLAIAAGDSQSAQNIQLQLAALNAEIQREGIGANLAISTTNANADTVKTAA